MQFSVILRTPPPFLEVSYPSAEEYNQYILRQKDMVKLQPFVGSLQEQQVKDTLEEDWDK